MWRRIIAIAAALVVAGAAFAEEDAPTLSNAAATGLKNELDASAPVVTRAVGKVALDTVILTFSAPMEPNSANELLNYQIIAASSGEALIIKTAILTNNSTNVILFTDPSTPRLAGENYTVVISDVRDLGNNLIRPNPASIQLRPEVLLIGFDTKNEWKYQASGADLTGTDWQGVAFDDSAWASGAVGIGFSGFSNGVPIRTTLAVALTNNTTYFRKRFIHPVQTNDVRLALRDVVEDGAIYYLNGIEVLRNRMPPGPVEFSTLANQSPRPTPITGPFGVAATNLQTGENILAVEVHQDGFWGDLELAVELVADMPGFAANPRLEIRRNLDGTILLQWNAIGYCLEERSALNANTPWSISTVKSGAPFTAGGAARFFRLTWCN